MPMHAERDMANPSVCLSVCLSVTLWCCIETNALKLFSPSGMTPVFVSATAVKNSRGNSLSGSDKYTWLEKFAIFDRNRGLSRKRHEISPWLLWNTKTKSR